MKSSMQKKRFLLPQTTSEVGAHFCIESVYGTVNILWVTGLIRMDGGTESKAPAAPAAPVEDTFDAWPSRQAKAAGENTRARIIVENQQRNDDPWY